ncbi:MAG: tRNA (adenosine(37)-N6)-threonylcarbamoyltransferase complex transferase subunit TsaD [Candidatus Colwellbacteria bacterium]|nr:tRNA (adenosine(37)-N6)-threonylcarbamoyltransferase complex transferase subunit TsaD [Candidatus Colwellbacteria bacterium]
MRILAVETSCDETALAVVDCSGDIENPSARIIENLVASQTATHAPFGGVVPNLAKREHIKNLPELYAKLATSPRARLENIDAVAVTVGPGLEPALWTGIEFAKHIARELGKPLLGANHLEGHLWSFLLNPAHGRKVLFPAVALIVSGGHTTLASLPDLTHYAKLGETQDDAAGEAFDKVARLLDLPYPGGPEIEKLARRGNPRAIVFPRPMLNDRTLNFSFAGLKTSVLYHLRQSPQGAERGKNMWKRRVGVALPEAERADVAASFQEAVIETLLVKTLKAAGVAGAQSILLSGGVAANETLKNRFRKAAKERGLIFLAPPKAFNTDNAAMIAVAAHMKMRSGAKKYRIAAAPNLNL